MRNRDGGGGAFTLVELLVVIAIVALLVAILLPALSRARYEARRVREMAAAQQLMVAYHAYAFDNHGLILPGLLTPSWVNPTGPRPWWQLRDPTITVRDDQGELVHSTTGARYPWRIWPYLGPHAFEGLVLDRPLFRQYSALDRAPDVADGASREYAYSNNPAFGANYAFLGTPPKARNWRWVGQLAWIEREDEVLAPDRLLTFASSRGPHADVPFGSTGWQDTAPQPGYFIVQAPRYPGGVSAYDQESLGWDPRLPMDAFGHLDLRWSRKAVVANFGGNIEMVGIQAGSRAGLRDMRRWCNWATAPDWTPPEPQQPG